MSTEMLPLEQRKKVSLRGLSWPKEKLFNKLTKLMATVQPLQLTKELRLVGMRGLHRAADTKLGMDLEVEEDIATIKVVVAVEGHVEAEVVGPTLGALVLGQVNKDVRGRHFRMHLWEFWLWMSRGWRWMQLQW